METNIGALLAELTDKLFDIHIELWDVVDMKKSEDDSIVAIAGRKNNFLVKLRSDHVEQIDELIMQAQMHTEGRHMEMNDTVGKTIEEFAFEKIRVHEENRETGKPDESTTKCDELKDRLQKTINAIFRIGS